MSKIIEVILILALGFCLGNTFQIFVQNFDSSDEVKNAILLCQSQVPENVTCKITAIPYEATVRLK